MSSPGRGFVDGTFIDKSGLLGSLIGRDLAKGLHHGKGALFIEGNEDRMVISDAREQGRRASRQAGISIRIDSLPLMRGRGFVCFDMHFDDFGMWKSLDIHLAGKDTGSMNVVLLQIVAVTFSRPFSSMLWWTRYMDPPYCDGLRTPNKKKEFYVLYF